MDLFFKGHGDSTALLLRGKLSRDAVHIARFRAGCLPRPTLITRIFPWPLRSLFCDIVVGTVTHGHLKARKYSRSSSREVRIRAPIFSVVDFSQKRDLDVDQEVKPRDMTWHRKPNVLIHWDAPSSRDWKSEPKVKTHLRKPSGALVLP